MSIAPVGSSVPGVPRVVDEKKPKKPKKPPVLKRFFDFTNPLEGLLPEPPRVSKKNGVAPKFVRRDDEKRPIPEEFLNLPQDPSEKAKTSAPVGSINVIRREGHRPKVVSDPQQEDPLTRLFQVVYSREGEEETNAYLTQLQNPKRFSLFP